MERREKGHLRSDEEACCVRCGCRVHPLFQDTGRDAGGRSLCHGGGECCFMKGSAGAADICNCDCCSIV